MYGRVFSKNALTTIGQQRGKDLCHSGEYTSYRTTKVLRLKRAEIYCHNERLKRRDRWKLCGETVQTPAHHGRYNLL